MWGRRPGRPGGCPDERSWSVIRQVKVRHSRGGSAVDIVVKGRHTEVPDRFRRHVGEKLAKVEGSTPRWCGWMSRCPRSATRVSPRSRSASRSTCHSRGPVDPGRGGRRRPVRRSRRRLSPSWSPGCAVPPTVAGCTTAAARRPRWPAATADAAHRAPAGPSWSRRPSTSTRGRLVIRREDPCRCADDAGPGPVRDGARRSRLLPVPRHRLRLPERGLPAPRTTTTASSGWTSMPPRPTPSARRAPPDPARLARRLAARCRPRRSGTAAAAVVERMADG